jgi:hypothetical protein
MPRFMNMSNRPSEPVYPTNQNLALDADTLKRLAERPLTPDELRQLKQSVATLQADAEKLANLLQTL